MSTTTEEPTSETAEEPKPEMKPIFEIKSLEDLRKVLVIAKGGNPEAQQAVADYMDLKNPTERANFMDKTMMLAVAQQDGFALAYPEFKSFKLVSKVISSATMGYKSKKSDQLMQIIQQTPNLKDITSLPEEAQKGFIAGLMNRGRTE